MARKNPTDSTRIQWLLQPASKKKARNLELSKRTLFMEKHGNED